MLRVRARKHRSACARSHCDAHTPTASVTRCDTHCNARTHSEQYPEARNYGAAGTVAGAAMAPAAQPPGRRFDPDSDGPRAAASPSPPVDAEYARRAACVADRFSAAAAPIGAHARVAAANAADADADSDPAAANATADADVALAGAAAPRVTLPRVQLRRARSPRMHACAQLTAGLRGCARRRCSGARRGS